MRRGGYGDDGGCTFDGSVIIGNFQAGGFLSKLGRY